MPRNVEAVSPEQSEALLKDEGVQRWLRQREAKGAESDARAASKGGILRASTLNGLAAGIGGAGAALAFVYWLGPGYRHRQPMLTTFGVCLAFFMPFNMVTNLTRTKRQQSMAHDLGSGES